MIRIVLLILLFSNVMWSQNVKSHQWKNRVVVISADKTNATLAEYQSSILIREKEKLVDRSIVIYKCIDKQCMFYDENQNLKKVQFDKPVKGFSVVLVGLDGGEKFKSNNIEKASVFFDLIDKMPMRRQELRNLDND